MILENLPSEFENEGYTFKAFGAGDVALVKFWLRSEHLSDWWTPSEESLEADSLDYARRYIASHQGREFAFIQCYDPAKVPEFWDDAPQAEGSYGIEQFVGDAQMLGFGHGTNFIKGFVNELKTLDEVKRIITQTPSDNVPGIRSFQQVGFRDAGDIMIPDGRAKLLSIEV